MLKKTQSTLIDGAVGALELRVGSTPTHQTQGLVVISHPHPQFGGTMDNKVVTTLEKTFSQARWQTVCYNFRGVGQSVGEYDGGLGEQKDLAAVVEWAREQFVDMPLTLAGFSFGSYISLQQAQTLAAQQVISVAPPVGLYDFTSIKLSADMRWSLIQGGQDEVINSTEVLSWARQLEHRPDVYWREQASHFFHGELLWLRKVVASLL